MSDRVKVWSPNGGGAIECYQVDAMRLVANGWSLTEPTKKAAAKVAKRATRTDEGLADGNTEGE